MIVCTYIYVQTCSEPPACVCVRVRVCSDCLGSLATRVKHRAHPECLSRSTSVCRVSESGMFSAAEMGVGCLKVLCILLHGGACISYTLHTCILYTGIF